MKINIIGGFFGTSGYANHTRNLANALNRFMDVKIITNSYPNWEKDCSDSELIMMNRPDEAQINLIIDLPFNWGQYCNKSYNIGFLVWEGDKIPLSFLDNIKDKRINQVWVPSNHVLEAIKATMGKDNWENQQILNKIKIVPHGVDLSVFRPIERETKEFIFLCNKGFRSELDRGGVQHAIKAFIEEFKKGEARLLVKINPAYTMSPENIGKLINKYAQYANKNITEIPEITFCHDNMNKEDINKLYNNCDVFLNPTEGEAFSLPCLEAMACGKPVITTNFGGQTDYTNNKNGILIDYELREVEHEILYEGIKWARPNIDQLKLAMRHLFNNRNEISDKGQIALNTAKIYTWENSAIKALEYIKELNITEGIKPNKSQSS
jgi:glycosyltransferase involved in cell wall biosynthesis